MKYYGPLVNKEIPNSHKHGVQKLSRCHGIRSIILSDCIKTIY